MKNSENIEVPFKEPAFWQEDWLRSAIDALDTRKMSPEALLEYEMSLAREAEVFNAKQKEINKFKTNIALSMVNKGFDIKTISEIISSAENM